MENSTYKTYVKSTVRAVNECNAIIVYNRYSFANNEDYKKISIYNLEQVYNTVINSGNYIKIEKEYSSEEKRSRFRFLCTDKVVNNGFNVIIYLSNTDDSTPIGFTTFTNTQGQERDIYIYVGLVPNVNEVVLNIVNSLDPARTDDIDYIGDTNDKYTSVKSINSHIQAEKPSSIKFTDSVSSINGSYVKNKIYVGTGIVNSSTNLKFNLGKNININPYNEPFYKYYLSYYGNDIVLCSLLNDDSGLDTCYSITSLAKRNIFGKQIVYTKYGSRYDQLKSIPGYSITITGFAGKYLECNATNNDSKQVKKIIYDVYLQDWVVGVDNIEKNYILIDPLDPTSKINKLPVGFSYNDAMDYLPEISSTHVDLSKNFNLTNIIKRGNWFILRKTINGVKIVVMTGITNTLYVTEDEFSNTMIINNNNILIKKSENYQLYSGINKVMYSIDAKNLLGIVDNNYTPSIIKFNDDLYNSELNKFRKNSYPSYTNNNDELDFIEGIPDIIGAIDGIIYYKYNNLINFL